MKGTDENKVDSLIAELHSFGDKPPPRFAWKRIADGLETAVKEEREELREAATSKMLEGATIIDNRGQGNAAVMREAAEAALSELDKFGQCHDARIHFSDIVHIGNAKGILRDALSSPPRQCDVGPADEQLKRWRKYCENFHYCVDCPVNKKDGISADCFANWSQMPYEEESL